MYTQPTSLEEYRQKLLENNAVTGYGLDTQVHIPCPFCAAPDFLSYLLIDINSTYDRPHVCSECTRGLIMIAAGDIDKRIIKFYQCSGPDQPDWFEPKMPRTNPANQSNQSS